MVTTEATVEVAHLRAVERIIEGEHAVATVVSAQALEPCGQLLVGLHHLVGTALLLLLLLQARQHGFVCFLRLGVPLGFQDGLVRGSGHKGLVQLIQIGPLCITALLLLVVHVAFVHRPLVQQDQRAETRDEHRAAHHLATKKEQQDARTEHEGETAPYISGEDADAHFLQVVHEEGHLRLHLRRALRLLGEHGLLLIAHEAEEAVRCQTKCQQQHEHAAHPDHGAFLHQLIPGSACGDPRLQQPIHIQHRQHRYRQRKHHEDHGHRAELIVAGHVLEEEVGERHVVTPPREHQREQ